MSILDKDIVNKANERAEQEIRINGMVCDTYDMLYNRVMMFINDPRSKYNRTKNNYSKLRHKKDSNPHSFQALFGTYAGADKEYHILFKCVIDVDGEKMETTINKTIHLLYTTMESFSEKENSIKKYIKELCEVIIKKEQYPIDIVKIWIG